MQTNANQNKECGGNMQLYSNLQDCYTDLKGAIQLHNGLLQECDIGLIKTKIDQLIWTTVFTNDANLKKFCRFIITEAAKINGTIPASIFDFYLSIARGKHPDYTVPAINIRTLTYDIACVILKLCKELKTSALILEIARSEIGYSEQRPAEYAACIMAAALKEDYKQPIFLQGDHFQVNRTEYFLNQDEEINELESLIKEAIDAEFYNIDIDASTIVNLAETVLDKQQAGNYETTARFIKLIREYQPSAIPISIGGEIGEIGGKNSTVEDLEAYMNGLNRTLSVLKIKDSILKLSIQTGTTHGGFVLPDGTLAQINIDFNTIKKLATLANDRYEIAGVVQHGASTLPKELFQKFPENKTVEIHLATEFQNIILDHPKFPPELKNAINTWVEENYREHNPQITEEQLIYKMRKYALGHFKSQLWNLPPEVKKEILETLRKTFSFIFHRLNIVNINEIINKTIKPVRLQKELPHDVQKELNR